ncbi:MAG: MetQ/NlpA family ABC transporter substrate-binding protein [Anaerococcus sp.]|nr:MetQ/NlpA family ABC transporter substrate-binding protein [Anaerococcus sp.]
MKKLLKISLGLILGLGLVGCGSANEDSSTIKVGVVGENNEVWEEVAKRYEDGTGKKIELVRFSDYNQPNEALLAKDIDLNAYQHYKFLKEFNDSKGSEDLIALGNTMLGPMGIYSKKIDRLDDLEDGARVAIPDDPSNGSRALFLLQAAGLIKVNGEPGDLISLDDLVDNPKNLDLVEMDASGTPRSLDDTDISIVNDNYALDSGLSIEEDALFMEDKDSQAVKEYINIIAARSEDKDREDLKEVVSYYQTDETKADYEKYTKGFWIPAW